MKSSVATHCGPTFDGVKYESFWHIAVDFLVIHVYSCTMLLCFAKFWHLYQWCLFIGELCALIYVFLQNRQGYSCLTGDTIASTVKDSPARLTRKGRGKAEPKSLSKDNSTGGIHVKEKGSSILESLRVFCTRFVRLNGILFTRTR